jgi:hypothetical protein
VQQVVERKLTDSGAKGVLSYWPGLVGPHDVKMRKSQIKFQSALQDLNVVRVSFSL